MLFRSEIVGWAKYWNARVIVDLKAGANTLELIVKIGRASCRERVEISVVAVSLKKQILAG